MQYQYQRYVGTAYLPTLIFSRPVQNRDCIEDIGTQVANKVKLQRILQKGAIYCVKKTNQPKNPIFFILLRPYKCVGFKCFRTNKLKRVSSYRQVLKQNHRKKKDNKIIKLQSQSQGIQTVNMLQLPILKSRISMENGPVNPWTLFLNQYVDTKTNKLCKTCYSYVTNSYLNTSVSFSFQIIRNMYLSKYELRSYIQTIQYPYRYCFFCAPWKTWCEEDSVRLLLTKNPACFCNGDCSKKITLTFYFVF